MQNATIPSEIASPQEPGRELVPSTVPPVDFDTHGHGAYAVQAAPTPAAGTWSGIASDDPADQRFCAAVDAITAVLAASADPDSDWFALRTALNLAAGRDARTGEK
ncbi:hypothetical protein AB0H97_29920 [Streptomyces sp. NPDC050788]|uniref:hypothetical protein n=1 Tax=Streptomyces sp. NPDC050788 TaxID=3155041 RepID=UPI00341FA534